MTTKYPASVLTNMTEEQRDALNARAAELGISANELIRRLLAEEVTS